MKPVLALLCALASHCHGQILPASVLPTVQAGIREVYNLEHDKAVIRFEAMIRESPNDPTGYAYLAWAIWLKELAKRQELSIDRFAETGRKRLEWHRDAGEWMIRRESMQ